MNKVKIIIAGGRDFTDWNYFLIWCEHTLCDTTVDWLENDIEVVSGGARGVDVMGEKFAKLYGFDIKKFPAEWKKYGKGAGNIRNKVMADYADVLIAFWDGKSRGTKHMISTAKNKKLEVHVIQYKNRGKIK